MLKKDRKTMEKAQSKANFGRLSSTIPRYEHCTSYTSSLYFFDNTPFYKDEEFQKQQAPLFFNWIHGTSVDELNKLIALLEECISGCEECGSDCHDQVLELLEEKIGFSMPYVSSLIADAVESERRVSNEKGMPFNGVDTFVHLLQCPLRALAGKMKGSKTGEYHDRNEQLIIEGMLCSFQHH
jgi:hypothetical protein